MNEAEFEEIRSDLREIKLAIIGQKSIGHVGLVEKVADHDKRLTHLERIALWGAGAIAVILAVIQFFKSLIVK